MAWFGMGRVRPRGRRGTRAPGLVVHPGLRIALCAILPVVGVGELVAAEVQKRKVPTDVEWRAAASAASVARKPGDMILVAPRWAEPLGRKALGEVDTSLVDLRMVGRADLETVPRVLELSIRGKDDPQTLGWKLEREQRFGPVRLRTLINPKPEKLVRDLVAEFGPDVQAMKLAPDGKSEPCRWETGVSPKIPNLFQGPSPAQNRYLCAPYDPGWTWVGTTVLTDLDWQPRRCVMMHPTESRTAVEWPARPIAKKVVAYVGLHVFNERDLGHSPLHVAITIHGKEVAHARHKDGDGWLRFEGSTAEFAGQSHPIRIETYAEGSPQFRTSCIAAELRE